MHLLDWLNLRLSQLPEFVTLEKNERKQVIKSCRWKALRQWQYWLVVIATLIISMVLSAVMAFWYINLDLRVFRQPLMYLSAGISGLLILALAYITQKIKIYFITPYFVRVMTERFNKSEIQAEHECNQQHRKKSIKRDLLLFVPAFLIAIVCVAIALRNPDVQGASLKIPDELTTPRIVINQLNLTKKISLEDEKLGVVTDIVYRNTLSESIYVGTMGALFTGAGLPGRFVRFEKNQNRINMIQLVPSDVFGFMDRGSWCCEARVIDINGKPLWSYGGGMDAVDDMASGDLDGDGLPEFAVGFNGGGGIHLLNDQGKKLWEFPDGNVWHVEIADLDGSGQKKIVHSNASGNITVRDKQGKIVSKSKPKPYFSDFSLIRWPDANGPERLLLVEDNTVWIFDAGANVVAKFPAPNSGTLGKGKGTLVAINKEKKALATIVDFENWHRSIFYLHDLSGELLYQEILSESCPAIAVLPAGEVKSKGLVIGCEGKILEYQIH